MREAWFFAKPDSVDRMIKAMHDRRPVEIEPPSKDAGLWYITKVYQERQPDHEVKWVVELIEIDPVDYAWPS